MQRVLCILCDAVHALPGVQASWLSPLGATVPMLKHPVIAPTFHDIVVLSIVQDLFRMFDC